MIQEKAEQTAGVKPLTKQEDGMQCTVEGLDLGTSTIPPVVRGGTAERGGTGAWSYQKESSLVSFTFSGK